MPNVYITGVRNHSELRQTVTDWDDILQEDNKTSSQAARSPATFGALRQTGKTGDEKTRFAIFSMLP